MKKLLTFLLIFSFPLVVNATSITSGGITGTSEAKPGDKVTLTFDATFDGLKKDDSNTKGIMTVVLTFETDEDVLVATKTRSDFDTEITKDGNSYLITSIIKENMPNTCKDGLLYCDNYKIDVDFVLKDTKKDTVDIKVTAVGAGVYESHLIDEEKLDEDKIEIITKLLDKTHKLKITKPESEKEITIPSSIAEEATIPKIEEALKTSSKTPTENKNSSEENSSKNNRLKSLTIKGYDLSFDRDINLYTIELKNDENALEVEAEPEDSTATVEIIGNTNLKENNNQIKIIVTSKNNDKRAYIVTAVSKKEPTKKLTEETIEIFGTEIEKKYVKYGIITISIIIGLLFIKLLFSLVADKIGNRKINKALKALDKDKDWNDDKDEK